MLDEVVRTDYGQFDLTWASDGGFDGNFDRVFHGQVNGLVGAAHPGGVYLHFARRSGGSPVQIVMLDAPPANNPSYQDVVEVSIVIPPGAVVGWTSWAGESSGSLPDLVPGAYRLRVDARDRDAGRDGEFADGPVDAYLLQLWPAPIEPDAILRVGSQDAAYWHHEVGNRR